MVARLPAPTTRRACRKTGARHLAHAVREPLLERVILSGEFFAPLLAAAVCDPDLSFCRWFIGPALYTFGRRRVTAALLNQGTGEYQPAR